MEQARSMFLRYCSVSALALVIISMVSLCHSTAAQPGAVVWIQPQGGNYQPGKTFDVEVRIEDVVDLYGVDVRISFEPSRLEVVETAVTPGDDLLSPPWLIFYNQVDNQAGTIRYVLTLLNPHPPVSGSGTLFSFHFRALTVGSATVQIEELTLCDINGELIPATSSGARYQLGHQVFLPLLLNGSPDSGKTYATVAGSSLDGTIENDWR